MDSVSYWVYHALFQIKCLNWLLWKVIYVSYNPHVTITANSTFLQPFRKHFCKKGACACRRETRENKRKKTAQDEILSIQRPQINRKLNDSFLMINWNHHQQVVLQGRLFLFLLWWLAFWCKGILSELQKVRKRGRQLPHMVWEKTQVVAGSLHDWRMHLVTVQRTQSQLVFQFRCKTWLLFPLRRNY